MARYQGHTTGPSMTMAMELKAKARTRPMRGLRTSSTNEMPAGRQQAQRRGWRR